MDGRRKNNSVLSKYDAESRKIGNDVYPGENGAVCLDFHRVFVLELDSRWH